MNILIGIKSCPFCGEEAYGRIGMNGIKFFYCTNNDCGACVSFIGEHILPSGTAEAENPLKNWSRRANVSMNFFQKEA